MFIWESATVLFDAYVTQPICTIPSLSPPSHPAILSLVSGVSSSSADGTFRYLAYAELLALASSSSSSDASHRGQLFNDQKHNPQLWTHLARESLLVLGRDYQLLLRRGAPPPIPAPKAPATQPKPSPPTEIVKPVELIRKPSIFKPGAGKQSPIRKVVEGLSSDGVLAQALDEGAEKVNVNVGAAIPELFRSVLHSPEEKPAVKGVVENKGKGAASILSTLDGAINVAYERWAPPQVREFAVGFRKWWTQERLSRRVEACFPNRELDVVVVDGKSPTPFCFSISLMPLALYSYIPSDSRLPNGRHVWYRAEGYSSYPGGTPGVSSGCGRLSC
jgi:nucleoporin NDC1